MHIPIVNNQRELYSVYTAPNQEEQLEFLIANNQGYFPPQQSLNLLQSENLVYVFSPKTTNSTSDFSTFSNKIYPNPSTTGTFTLDINTDNYKINIYDSMGKLLFSQTNTNQIDLSSFTKGIYSISIETKSSTYRTFIIYS